MSFAMPNVSTTRVIVGRSLGFACMQAIDSLRYQGGAAVAEISSRSPLASSFMMAVKMGPRTFSPGCNSSKISGLLCSAISQSSTPKLKWKEQVQSMGAKPTPRRDWQCKHYKSFRKPHLCLLSRPT
eukprot:TRINITY_DN11034_c0_g1_i3.p3 TRINITY_DN11034_c0_g1~~TRINITY_DN11034_c0_g1_i3.p3  ORF type:complete len:127 (-),score=15.53 TRINITY_DN11034_c0_g1_i3:2420-2800(-)